MFRSGEFVARHVTPAGEFKSDLGSDQIQPNGVDLTLASVFEPTEAGRLTQTGKRIADRDPVPTDGQSYRLDPGGYIATYDEVVEIPDGHVGFVFPRSSLMRNGAMLNTAVWDTGYEGRGEGLLQVYNEIAIQRGARFAQFVLARTDADGSYDGSHQGERL